VGPLDGGEVGNYCYISASLGPAKMLRYAIHMCRGYGHGGHGVPPQRLFIEGVGWGALPTISLPGFGPEKPTGPDGPAIPWYC
jgi:hypothetical protein